MEWIKDKLRNYLETEITTSKIPDDLNLIENRIIDSLSLMKIVLFIENEFKINTYKIDYDLSDFHSIDSISSNIILKNISIKE